MTRDNNELQRLFELANGRPVNFGWRDFWCAASIVVGIVAAIGVAGYFGLQQLAATPYNQWGNPGLILIACVVCAIIVLAGLCLCLWGSELSPIARLSAFLGSRIRFDPNNPADILAIVNYLDSEAKRRYGTCMEPIGAGLDRAGQHLGKLDLSLQALREAGESPVIQLRLRQVGAARERLFELKVQLNAQAEEARAEVSAVVAACAPLRTQYVAAEAREAVKAAVGAAEVTEDEQVIINKAMIELAVTCRLSLVALDDIRARAIKTAKNSLEAGVSVETAQTLGAGK